MRCYHCQSLIPDGAKFCTFCGQVQGFDRNLIAAAAAGDNQALTELYNRTYSSVYHTVKFLIKDEDTALDIVQDSYLGAFRHLSQLKDADKFGPWVKRIAHNRAVDYLRQTKPVMFSEMVSDDSEEAVDFTDERPENSPDIVIDRQETARLLREILDSLPADQRACVTMYYYEQLSVKEIAEELGIPEATVKSRLVYGRNKIESRVKDLERKGTKLYGFAPIPFLLVLLHSYTVQAAEIPAGQILASVLSKLAFGTGGAGAAAGTAHAAGAGTGAAAGTAHAAGAGAGAAAGATHAAGAGLGIRIVSIIAAIAVIGGGGAAAWRGITVLRDRQETAQESSITAENGNTGNVSESSTESVEIISTVEAPAPAAETPAVTLAPATPEPTQIPAEEEQVPPLDVYSEYLNVVRTYIDRINTFSADSEGFQTRYQSGDYDNLDDGINYHLISEYLNYGGEMWFLFNDWNLDGTPELELGLTNTYHSNDTLETIEVYTFNGVGAKQLFHDFQLGYHNYAEPLSDGTMRIQIRNSEGLESQIICRISEDRDDLEIIEKFAYDDSSGKFIGDKGSALSPEDFWAMYHNNALPIDENSTAYPVSEEGIQEYINAN